MAPLPGSFDRLFDQNSDFERKKSATILGNDQMDEVKAKLDSVHKLLRKQVCLVEEQRL